jgi:protein-tyrosine-phosphatase
VEDVVVVSQSPGFLKLLAHELRWQALVALAHSDRRVQELVDLLGQPANLVSYHLKRLRDMHLVTERRSTADARDIYYSLDLSQLRQLYFATGGALHPALNGAGNMETSLDKQAPQAEGPPVRVLFLCTHNSARSQMAEGIMRHLGGGMVEVHSAGTHPSYVHPHAVQVMEALSIDVSKQRSKHLDEYSGQSFDYVVTVCDRVREVCPLYPDDPEQIHWSFPDPAAVEGEQEQYAAFVRTAQELMTRIRFLLLVIENERRGKGK